jgi:hypothetical protein
MSHYKLQFVRNMADKVPVGYVSLIMMEVPEEMPLSYKYIRYFHICNTNILTVLTFFSV